VGRVAGAELKYCPDFILKDANGAWESLVVFAKPE
jgi:hypothetical protein